MHRVILLQLATLLVCGCGQQPRTATAVALDSSQLVARAFAAYDSARGIHDSLPHVVRTFVRDAASVTISLWPASRTVQGGSVDVRLDAAGRVLEVRAHQ